MKQPYSINRKIIRSLLEQGNTISEIADRFDLTADIVLKILKEKAKRKPKKKKIKIYPKTKSHWIKYGRDYKRELLRAHFNYTCQKCGRVWKEGERRLDVHHLSCDPDDTRIYDRGSIEDLVNIATVLCHACHLNLPEHRRKMQGVRGKDLVDQYHLDK